MFYSKQILFKCNNLNLVESTLFSPVVKEKLELQVMAEIYIGDKGKARARQRISATIQSALDKNINTVQ